MNALTKKIKDKGYSLPEFLNKIGFSLRWYREHSKPEAKRHDFLSNKIEELEHKK